MLYRRHHIMSWLKTLLSKLFVCSLLIVPILCAPCPSGQYAPDCESVLIIHAAETFPPYVYAPDVKSQLQQTGLYTTVDTFDGSTGSPTLSTLQAFDAVLVYNFFGFLNVTAIGNVLAEYWDNGGVVVLAALANITGRTMQGTFGIEANGYILIDPNSGLEQPTDSLGAVNEPQSPLMIGVRNISAIKAYRNSGSIINNGIVVANWSSNGRPLIVRGTKNGRNLVQLNFFPPSSSVNPDFWIGNGTKIITNALQYSMVACRNCSAGSYWASNGFNNSKACVKCQTGKYSTETEATSSSVCISCSAGKYSSSSGATTNLSCGSCVSGTYSLASASSCSGCNAGKYSVVNGSNSSTNCISCIAGTYSSAQGATTCISCKGQFSSATGATSSSICFPVGGPCPPGQYTATCRTVLIVHADFGIPPFVNYISDVRSNLLPFFQKVDVFDAVVNTPTLEQLMPYDAVLVYSDLQIMDFEAIGDVLAAYWDSGGGVVIATFTNIIGHAVLGSFGSPQNGYILIEPSSFEQPSDSLGMIYEPQSPLVAGVKSLSSATAFRSTGSVINNGTVVATWNSNNRPLIVRGTRKGRNLVQLNMFPPSNASSAAFWSGDGAMILKNALQFCVAPCAKCIPGTYLPTNSSNSSAACLYCPAGKYASGFGETVCSNCNKGSFSFGVGSSSAYNCTVADCKVVTKHMKVNPKMDRRGNIEYYCVFYEGDVVHNTPCKVPANLTDHQLQCVANKTSGILNCI